MSKEGLDTDETGYRIAFRARQDSNVRWSFSVPDRQYRQDDAGFQYVKRAFRPISSNELKPEWQIDLPAGVFRTNNTSVSNSAKLELKMSTPWLQPSMDNEHAFLLTASGSQLLMLDRTGNIVWEKHLAATAVSMSVAPDGKSVIIATHNGFFEWHRITDGEAYLTLFPHGDGKRWILWTPSGFFDASPGAESILGWLQDRGPLQTPDFYPVSLAADSMRRPDVINLIMKTQDEAMALKLLNPARGLPPLTVNADKPQTCPPARCTDTGQAR